MTRRSLALMAAVAAILTAPAARADVIDGAWCHDRLGRMVIQGKSILTPGGTRTEGDYSRHTFRYVVPAGDPQAGLTIAMLLLNEETMRVRTGAAEETWHRCGPSISALPFPRPG